MGDGPQRRLLVVDDNEDNRDMLARRLSRKGFEVDTAEGGVEALRLVHEVPYDLVILDVMMPGMNGLEVLEKIRETYPRAELPVLMATAKTGSEDVVEALRRGANDYVTKPIDFPVVLARLENHLQTRLQASSVPAPATSIPADGRVAPGSILDARYEVVRMLGEGSFAIVYEAKQLSTGQRVAIKILHTHRADGDAEMERRRFEREMQTIGRLHHPHIVRLIDFGTLKATLMPMSGGWMETADGAGFEVDRTTGGSRVIVRRLPYIVMEYVEGQTLQELLREKGAMDPCLAVDLVLPVVSAVAEGHRSGVIHRDLKPPNIIVGRSIGARMHPTVLDFGIAKPQDEETLMRRDESFFGTPEYMAPEVLAGASAGAAADQYALGLMLYELLLGERAFRAGSYVELLNKVALQELPPLHTVSSATEELAAIVTRAIDRDPERRFRSVASLGKSLLPFASPEVASQWSGGFSVPTDPPPPPLDTDTPAPPAESNTADPSEAEVERARLAKVSVWVLLVGVALLGSAAIVWWFRS